MAVQGLSKLTAEDNYRRISQITSDKAQGRKLSPNHEQLSYQRGGGLQKESGSNADQKAEISYLQNLVRRIR